MKEYDFKVFTYPKRVKQKKGAENKPTQNQTQNRNKPLSNDVTPLNKQALTSTERGIIYNLSEKDRSLIRLIMHRNIALMHEFADELERKGWTSRLYLEAIRILSGLSEMFESAQYVHNWPIVRK